MGGSCCSLIDHRRGVGLVLLLHLPFLLLEVMLSEELQLVLNSNPHPLEAHLALRRLRRHDGGTGAASTQAAVYTGDGVMECGRVPRRSCDSKIGHCSVQIG